MKDRTLNILTNRLFIDDFDFKEYYKSKQKQLSDLEIFNLCPYVFKCYVDYSLAKKSNAFAVINSYTEDWNSTENKVGLLEIKIVNYDGQIANFIWYDNHHRDLGYSKINPDNFILKGNIIVDCQNEKVL